MQHTNAHTHTRLTALFPGLPRWVGSRKVKPIWILLKQETVSGSGISWTICKSATCSRQITTPAPHHSVFYRPDALPAAQQTASKHWRPFSNRSISPARRAQSSKPVARGSRGQQMGQTDRRTAYHYIARATCCACSANNAYKEQATLLRKTQSPSAWSLNRTGFIDISQHQLD